MVRLSVITPVYNVAANGVLKFSMDSLVNQTLFKKGGMEIIAVDDCSTDNSLEILRSYEKEYEGFHVYQTPRNMRQGAARNLGFKHAKGEWIAWIDSDDFVVPECYEKALAAGDNEKALSFSNL